VRFARAIVAIPRPTDPEQSDRQGATLGLLGEVDLRLRMEVQCRLVPDLGWWAAPQDVIGAVAFVLSDEPLEGLYVWTGLAPGSGPWPHLEPEERERRRAEVLSRARECVIPQAFELLRERCHDFASWWAGYYPRLTARALQAIARSDERTHRELSDLLATCANPELRNVIGQGLGLSHEEIWPGGSMPPIPLSPLSPRTPARGD
jgi:hypothetical protein